MNDPALAQAFSWRDKWLAMRVGAYTPCVEIWVRRSSFQKCQQGLQKLAGFLPLKRRSSGVFGDAEHIAKIVELGIRRYSIYPSDCLVRSLVLQYVLARLGTSSEIRLGVRTITGQFEAHAWVEVNNTPLNEVEAVNEIYSAFDWTAGRTREAKK